MTNTVDILCVGGPLDSVMFHARKPTTINGTYVTNEWRDPDTEEGYWIATNPEYPVDDVTIKFAIAAANFTPAWNLRT